MKKGIHPEYVEAKVICSCGNVIQTRATKPELHIEICSTCHPFFTGKQKFVDAAGRVERFEKRYKKFQQKKKPTLIPVQAAPQADRPETRQAEAGQVKQPEAKQTEKPEAKLEQTEAKQAKQPETKAE